MILSKKQIQDFYLPEDLNNIFIKIGKSQFQIIYMSVIVNQSITISFDDSSSLHIIYEANQSPQAFTLKGREMKFIKY